MEHIESGGHSISFSPVINGELSSTKFRFGPHHVLFGKLRPYLAKIACPNFEGICSTDILPILPGPGVDQRYLAYFLRQQRIVDWASTRATGINLPRLSPKELATLEIPLPPLDEQRRIAAILDRADALRRKRKRALELLDGLTQSIFLEMFGDPVSNPKRLRRSPLGDVIKVKSGNGLTANQMDPDGTVPVYGGNGINGHHSEKMFDEPQIVIGRVGVYCGVVHMTVGSSWVTDNALYVSEIKGDIDRTYLFHALRHADLNQYAGRAAQPLISGGRIYPVEILVPDLKRQLRFSKAVCAVSQFVGVSNKADQFLEGLFASLQSRAFSGQL